MTEHDAVSLIRAAVPATGGRWADLGAGTGTFTRALATILGSAGQVLAIEPEASARRELVRQATLAVDAGAAAIAAQDGDFTQPLALSGLSGVLMANSLHLVETMRQAAVLRQLSGYLQPNGRIVVVEYDQEVGNQWVPYPVSFLRLGALCKSSQLTAPTITGRMPSAFGGKLYSAWTAVG